MTKGEAHLYYCGRMLGQEQIPGSDGRCGPDNGPQCIACKNSVSVFNLDGFRMTEGLRGTLYCGRMLGFMRIPGSDGRCGPNNGP